jgi:hypothetical protein
MPRRAGERPAAYTRTRHLERFLDRVSASVPVKVDVAYVQERLELRGGDVRAFLGSLRVLGLIDGVGRPTDRLIQTRSVARRPVVLCEALREAYPDLVADWEAKGSVSRQEVEEHFKMEYGLGASSAGPAAKLFMDLWRNRPSVGVLGRRVAEAASKGGEAASGPTGLPLHEAAKGMPEAWSGETDLSRREEIAKLLAGLVQPMIEHNWDAERIQLVFNGIERLIRMIGALQTE